MNELIARTLAWMIAELILTGVLFGLYFGLRRFMPVAADRYRFLKLAFVVVLFLPWLPFPSALLISTDTTSVPSSIIATIVKVQPNTTANFWLHQWIPAAVVFVYWACAIFFIARLLVSLYRLRRLAFKSTLAFVHEGIEVRKTAENIPPATFGLVRPLILIPGPVLKNLSAEELQMVLEHEMHHIRRCDYLFNLLKAGVQAALVFSPFIHRIAKAFVEDMELSCDALVLGRCSYGVKDYGSLLLRLTSETRPRMDLVYSGLFVSNSFISRRINAMKNLNHRTRRTLSLAAFSMFGLVIGPTVASLGLDSAVENAIAATTTGAKGFAYEAKLITGNDKSASASGTLNLHDGKPLDIGIGSLQLMITPQKVSEGWKLAIEVRDPKTKGIVTSANIVTNEKEGAQIHTETDEPKSDDDVKSFSLSLSPMTANASNPNKSPGLKQMGDMVKLSFSEPTNIKNIIKTMAQVSGKNIILSRDIDAKVQIVSEHAVTREEAYKAFISALDIAGLTTIEEGKVIRIVRKPKAG